ncbi:MAG: hypothetical protein GC152_15690 [Alphaproteobacteria bacterium]|nr:hypothetical protein [Alphaproteobacteria bacterium]
MKSVATIAAASLLVAASAFLGAAAEFDPRAQSTAPTPAPASEVDFATYRPRLELTRIDSSDAPKIDGRIEEEVWARAAQTEAFYQVEPANGAEPSQRTRAYVMYDDRNLYVAYYCFDTNPELIRRALMERDAQLRDDDGARVFIDSFSSRRDGYAFGTNPNGVRVDGLIENNVTFRGEWDAIWNVAAQVVEDGWTAEFQIPFQSISFDPNQPDWNVQLIRVIRRNNEELRWSNVDQTRGRVDFTNAGAFAGIRDVKSGSGIEAQVFATGASSYNWETDELDAEFRPSANVFYKVTSSLTASATYNPDFSDAPLDARQVNTGRFSLFFPETRDFFLQDNSIFEFGGRNFQDNKNGLPFFTRNIGIVDGSPVDIIGGGKLSGKAGPVSLGLITSYTDDFVDGRGDVVEGQLLSAGRISMPVLAESKLGVAFTSGDPTGRATNTVAGADFQYRNSTRWPGQLFADFAYQRSFDDSDDGRGVVDDDMFSGEIAYRSQRWNWTLQAKEIGADYAPRLGFLNRSGTRQWSTNGFRVFRMQGGPLRRIEVGGFADAITDLDDELLDRFIGGWIEAETNDGDLIEVRARETFLDIRQPFAIAGILPVPVGEYRHVTTSFDISTTPARPVSVYAYGTFGGIYDGAYTEFGGGFRLRPSRFIDVGAGHEYNGFDLPTGSLGVHIFTADATIAFTPWITLKTDIQYDNISENFTFFSRFRWEPKAGQEVFLAFGHSAVIDRNDVPGSFRAQGSSLALRLGNTFRF